MTLDALNDAIEAAPASTAPRMYRKQYAVIPPGGTKITGYARSTTVAKTLDDTSNLDKWGKRMVAIGMTRRPDLLSTAALHTADTPDAKRELDAVCEQAHIAGGGTVRRDQGTAIHKMMELAHTDPSYVIPELHRPEVEAVNAALSGHGLEVVPEFSEMLCVLDAHQLAGRPDLVVRSTSCGTLYVADLKTGASVDYSQLAWSVQFAIPANADNRYVQGPASDGSEDERHPMPELSRDTAIILHIQPGGTLCDVYDLDIAKGYEALDVAMEVRRLRSLGKSKRTPLLVARNIAGGGDEQATAGAVVTPAPVTPEGGDTTTTAGSVGPVDDPSDAATLGPLPAILHEADTAWVLNRVDVIREAGHIRTLNGCWPDGIAKPGDIRKGAATWSAADLDAITDALYLTEARWEMHFGEQRPSLTAARAEEAREAEKPVRPTLANPGDMDDEQASDDNVRTLRRMLHAYLSDEQYEANGRAVLRWGADAARQGRAFAMGDPDAMPPSITSERRYRICLAALDCAVELLHPTHADPEFGVRAALALVIGEELQPTWTTGAVLGSLTTTQAIRLSEITATHRASILEDGTPQLTAVA
jgi:hypothetical protein